MKKIVMATLVLAVLAGWTLAEEKEKVGQELVYVQIKKAREAIASSPANAGAHRRLVRAYYLWKRMGEVTAEYENKLAERPDDAVLTYALGLCHSYAGDKARATELYQKALTLDPGLGYAYYSLGTMAHGRNELDAARDHYQKALERNPRIPEAHHNLGGIYLAERDYGKAVEHLELAAKLAPEDLGTLYNLGCAYVRAGLADPAVDTFLRLVSIAPGKIEASIMLAEAYHLKGLREPEYVRKSANEHNEIGVELLGRKQYQAAERQFLRSVEVDPTFVRPYNNLAWLYATAEDQEFVKPAQAVKLAQMAVELTQGENWHCLDTLAEAYFVSGQLELAVDRASQALKLAKRSRYLRTRLARFQEEVAKLQAGRAEPGTS